MVGKLPPAFVQWTEKTMIYSIADRPVIVVYNHIHLRIALNCVIMVVVPYIIVDMRCHTHIFPWKRWVFTEQIEYHLIALGYG